MRNRIVLAPMTRARSLNNKPTEHVVEYYRQRATAGLVITEATGISREGLGWIDAPGIWTDEQVEAWKPVVDAVHKEGSIIYLQLWHMGRTSHSSFNDGKPPVGPSPIAAKTYVHTADGGKVDCEVPRELTLEDITRIIGEYRKAAENAKKAGFDGVEFHGANGYLGDEFLQSCSNQRTDKYGGSIENRYRFYGEVVDELISVFGAKNVGARLSPNGVYGGMGSPDFREQFLYAAEQLGKKDIAYVHFMDGLGFGFHEQGEPMTLAEFRKVIPKSVAIIGNVGYTGELAEERVSSGDADAIAFGRPYIANPDLPERLAKGLELAASEDPSTWFSPDLPDRKKYSTGWGFTDFPTAEAGK